jgi:hypothetical protein
MVLRVKQSGHGSDELTDEYLADDYLSEDDKAEIKQVLEKEIESGLNPYFDRIDRGLFRLFRLVAAAVSMRAVAVEMKATADQNYIDVSDEVLRSVVVLNHAYLEDFLRTLALTFLPISSESDLNKVPLAGTEGRAEKFYLGALAKHRGKTVEQLIRESVSDHMEQRTFNDVTEIMRFLESLGLSVPMRTESATLIALADQPKVPSYLDAMMRRRHTIVHNADLDKTGEHLQPIDTDEVINWLKVTQFFLSNIAGECFRKEYPLTVIQERVRKAIANKHGEGSGPELELGSAK